MLEFQQFWQTRAERSLAANFEARLGLADAIMSEWVLAYHAAQELFIPPEQKPAEALTDEERREFGRPKSPLFLARLAFQNEEYGLL